MAERVFIANRDNEKEIWLPVVGWEAFYEVSSFGRVRSLDRDAVYRCFCGHGQITRRKKGKVLSAHVNEFGYTRVALANGEGGKTHLVHQLVCEAFHGPNPGECDVAHGDGDPGNNHYTNLRWATRSENAADRWKHGTMLHAGAAPWSKATDEQLQEMRRDSSLTNRQWAERLGMHRAHISKIRLGEKRSRRPDGWVGEWLSGAPPRRKTK